MNDDIQFKMEPQRFWLRFRAFDTGKTIEAIGNIPLENEHSLVMITEDNVVHWILQRDVLDREVI